MFSIYSSSFIHLPSPMLKLRPLHLVLLAYLALGLIYDQATPTFESSDEVWHYGLVRELAQGRGLPVQQVGVLTPYRQEGSQTPAYYVAAAALTFWIDDSDFDERNTYNPFGQAGVPGTPVNANMMRHSDIEAFPWKGVTLAVHLLRWFSLLLGVGTILLTHRIALALFPERTTLALLAAAMTAFNPMFLFISAAVNNDNGLWLVSSLVIYLVILVVLNEVASSAHSGGRQRTKGRLRTGRRREQEKSPSAHSGVPAGGREQEKSPSEQGLVARLLAPRLLPWTLGVILGLAIITKLSGLVLAPVVGLLLAWRAWRRSDWREFVRHSAIVGGVVLVLTGWWFVRNLILYGELLGVRMMTAIVGVERPRPASIIDLVNEVQGWWFSLWGVFGAFSVLPGLWVYGAFAALTLLAVAGGALSIWRVRGTSGRPIDAYMPHAFAFTFMGLTLVGIIWWTYTQYASQGRLVLGAIGPLSTFLAAGLLALVGARREALTARLLAGGLFAVALVIPIKYIFPIYVPPPALTEADLPADLLPVRARINAEIELVGYTVDDQPRQPGDILEVTLYWRGLAPMEVDYNLALNVHGRDFEPVGKLDTWPGGGLLPTAEWTPGLIYADAYPLPLAPEATAPTLLRLDVTFWQDELSNRLPIRAPDGAAIPSLILDVGRLIPADPPVYQPQIADGSTLEGGFMLLGYDLPAQAAPGETANIVLYWQAAQQPAANYTVFIHLQDEAGATVAQTDGPPLDGDWPTSAWLPGMSVADPHPLQIPVDLPPGDYTLALGLYEPETGARLAAFTPSGEEWRDWAIRHAQQIQ